MGENGQFAYQLQHSMELIFQAHDQAVKGLSRENRKLLMRLQKARGGTMGNKTNFGTAGSAGSELFRGMTTVDQKLNRLAEAFFDHRCWREEESNRMDSLEERIKKLEGFE